MPVEKSRPSAVPRRRRAPGDPYTRAVESSYTKLQVPLRDGESFGLDASLGEALVDRAHQGTSYLRYALEPRLYEEGLAAAESSLELPPGTLDPFVMVRGGVTPAAIHPAELEDLRACLEVGGTAPPTSIR